jgi:hypothetical protein
MAQNSSSSLFYSCFAIPKVQVIFTVRSQDFLSEIRALNHVPSSLGVNCIPRSKVRPLSPD